jgi:hypothetical protein
VTTCIAVNRELTVSKCPLHRGACYWQHRQTHECRATTVEMTVQEFCSHVGIKGSPTEDQVGRFMIKLRAML